ncbi:MAG: hypothetical protein ACK4YP_03345, partial [Myxococcota bacterium]
SGPGAVFDLAFRSPPSSLVGGPLARRALRGWAGEARCDGQPRGRGHLAGLYASALDGGALPHLRGFTRAPRPCGHVRVVTIDADRHEVMASLIPFALGLRRGVAKGVCVEAARELSLTPAEDGVYMVDGEIVPLDGPLRVTAGPPLDVVVAGS